MSYVLVRKVSESWSLIWTDCSSFASLHLLRLRQVLCSPLLGGISQIRNLCRTSPLLSFWTELVNKWSSFILSSSQIAESYKIRRVFNNKLLHKHSSIPFILYSKKTWWRIGRANDDSEELPSKTSDWVQ